MRIVFTGADDGAPPCGALTRAIDSAPPHAARQVPLAAFARGEEAVASDCEWADLIVVTGGLPAWLHPAIQHWKARGKAVVATLDGAAAHPDRPLPAHLRCGLQLVDGALVSSPQLAEAWAGLTQVHYLPPLLDLQEFAAICPVRHEGIILGFSGSLDGYAQETSLAEALIAVCRARPEVRLLPGETGGLQDYPALIDRQMPCPPASAGRPEWAWVDLGLVPSASPAGTADRVAILRYMLLKLPWAARFSERLADLAPYGWLVPDAASAWERVLIDMIDNLDEYREEAAHDPYLYGLSQTLQTNLDKLLALFASLAARAHPPRPAAPA